MGNSFIIDFTDKRKSTNFNIVKKLLLKTKGAKILELIDYIHPLTNLSKKQFDISNHINLSGVNPLQGANFVSLTDIYKSKNGIVVVGLKEGVEPNSHEKKILLKSNVKAYCYNLVPTVILAASLGFKIKAIGIVKEK